jgi:hypothetical protein
MAIQNPNLCRLQQDNILKNIWPEYNHGLSCRRNKTQDTHNFCFKLKLIFIQTTNFKGELYTFSSHKALLGYARAFQNDYCPSELNSVTKGREKERKKNQLVMKSSLQAENQTWNVQNIKNH